jgi:hypothetical protein
VLRRFLFGALLSVAAGVAVAKPPAIIVYGPTVCLSCIDYAEHLQNNGFAARFEGVADMDGFKRRHKVPVDVESLSTSLVAGYVIEGPVPAEDIQRLLQQKPKALGLAVPGLPRGAPGREISSPSCERGCTILDTNGIENVVRREAYETLLVAPDGQTRIWARH